MSKTLTAGEAVAMVKAGRVSLVGGRVAVDGWVVPAGEVARTIEAAAVGLWLTKR